MISLQALCLAANDPVVAGRFWAGVLGWDLVDDGDDGVTVVAADDTGFDIRLVPTDEPKTWPNQTHLDLTSTSLDDQQATVERVLGLGGRHLDIGQTPDEGHVVLADPDGNELCVIEPGNSFLADCGFVGAVNGDGSEALGRFWSEALGWPLVWDQDEETAIRSPLGGPKFTWGGPPVNPKLGINRWHWDLVSDGDQEADVDRLVALGASRVDAGHVGGGRVTMADPDGNEFCVLPPSRGGG